MGRPANSNDPAIEIKIIQSFAQAAQSILSAATTIEEARKAEGLLLAVEQALGVIALDDETPDHDAWDVLRLRDELGSYRLAARTLEEIDLTRPMFSVLRGASRAASEGLRLLSTTVTPAATA